MTKDYSSNNLKLRILNKINFQINENDIISIVGPSGSGKSTFLNILGLLDSNYWGKNIPIKKGTDNFGIIKLQR